MSDPRDALLAILDEVTYGRPPPVNDGEPLELDSFTVISLVEELERCFGFRVTPDEVIPDNLATLGKILAFVANKRAGSAP